MIAAPVVTLQLDSPGGQYQPGERLRGHFQAAGAAPWPVRSAELSVLWYTAGQGDEDFAVHHFERFVDEPGRPLDLRLTAPLRRRAAAQPAELRRSDCEGLLVRAAASLSAGGRGGCRGGGVSAGPRAGRAGRRMNRLLNVNPRTPSRHANPFATCWTRPGAIAFRFGQDESAEQLVARLAAMKWQGEIVGPHGSGKSTLVETLKSHLAAAGRTVSVCTLRAGQRRLPTTFLRQSLATRRPLIVIDGYEQLSWLSRMLLRWRTRRAATGLLVTSHAPTGLPTLYHMRPSRQLALDLVSTLTAQNPSPISASDVVASHECHGSNLRELLFALYDRHEALVPEGSSRR